ncbi:MAG: hypothetical protein ACRDPH_16865 [Marmoricola sp.]
MASRVIWHIGLMKSGTTFIQRRLTANRADLRGQGILFPGPWRRQVSATKDLIGRHRGMTEAEYGTWETMRSQIEAHPGTAVISMEYLGSARPTAVARAPEQFPDSENLVVLTVRDLGRSVPAMWQEALKNRGDTGWSEYLRAIRKGEGPGRHFWGQMSAGAITDRWAEAFGPEALALVTVPPPGAPRGLLWERFCGVTGVPVSADREGTRANASLGVGSALLLRELNAELEGLGGPAYKRLVKHGLGNTTLTGLRDTDDPIGFTVPGWLHRRAGRMQQRLRDSGVRVVGDLDELEPQDVPGVDPDEVSTERIRQLAVRALAAQVRTAAQHEPDQAADTSRPRAVR